MNQQENSRPLKFRLFRITTDQFAVLPDVFNKNKKNINISIGLKFGLDSQRRIIASFVKVEFEQNQRVFIVLEVGHHYEIEIKSFDELNKIENKIIIPKDMAMHLVSLTIGTLRGVLHCKTENTEFEDLILPTINITELIKGDVELDIK